MQRKNFHSSFSYKLYSSSSAEIQGAGHQSSPRPSSIREERGRGSGRCWTGPHVCVSQLAGHGASMCRCILTCSAKFWRCIIVSVLARDNRKEWCFLRDENIAVVLLTFFQPHQKRIVYLRAVEHHSSAL